MSALRVVSSGTSTAAPTAPVESRPRSEPRSPPVTELQTQWYRTTIADPLPAGFPRDVADALKAAGIPSGWLLRAFTEGLSASEAADAMHLAMLSAYAKHFGIARLAVELVQKARAQDGLSAEQVRAFIDPKETYYVMRPDGVLANAISGRPVEQFALRHQDGRLRAGAFEVGALYRKQAGLLYNVNDPHAPGYELPLQHDLANAVLDGMVEASSELVVGGVHFVQALAEHPLETLGAMVRAFAQLPETAVKLAFDAPEDIERFRQLPREEQAKFAGKIAAHVLLAVAGTRAIKGVGGSLPKVTLPQFRIQVLEVAGGPLRPMIHVEAIPMAVTGPPVSHLVSTAAMASMQGALTEPKVRHAVQHHLRRRGIEDPRLDATSVEQLIGHLKTLKGDHANAQITYVRNLVERLDQAIARATPEQLDGFVHLDDLSNLLRATKALTPKAHDAMLKFAERRLRKEFDKLVDAAPAEQKRLAERLVAVAEEGGVDLGQTLSLKAQGKLHQALAGARVKPDGVAKMAEVTAPVGEAARVQATANMKAFFETEFGTQLKAVLSRSSGSYDGQTVFVATKKLGEFIRKGDRVYLDGLHKNHLEVFGGPRRESRAVLNLDGTRNDKKSRAAYKRRAPK